MKKRQAERAMTRIFIADFETTVYKDQTSTEVWAAAIVELTAPDEEESVIIFNNIQKFMIYLYGIMMTDNCIVYFHNLKFDGSYIMYHILKSGYWKPYTYIVGDGLKFLENIYKMPNGHYCYSISNKGMWYTIRLKDDGHYCEFRDSLKLLPFTVRKIGKDFKLKHQKLEMEYEGYRAAGGEITEDEKHYIANDVLVVKEALEFMFSQGHDKLTIGSCCMAEYKSYYPKDVWNAKFPNLYQYFVADDTMTAGEYIRDSYKGGWCYVKPEIAGLDLNMPGVTADVNSLYPSQMVSESGNYYPVGEPHYFKGDIPEEALINNRYYFIRVKTRFFIKDKMLPTLQIKGHPLYYGREWLKSSDVVDPRHHETILEERPTLTLTMTDWEMLQRHYNLKETEIIDGIWFDTEIGLFDKYINKYAEIKMNSVGAMRQLAKLFLILNNLYGKFATSPDNSYKIEYIDDDDCLKSYIMDDDDKTPGYIAIGSAITSYARRFTITAAQANYDTFCYADTDSIHCIGLPEMIKGAPEDPVKFNHWKYETCWDYAKFVRAKTYVEHVTHEDLEEVDEPYYNMKCAGMSDHVKQLFLWSVQQNITEDELKKLDDDEKEFVQEQRTFEDFKVGLRIPGMLKAKAIPGGTLLDKGDYEMRPNLFL